MMLARRRVIESIAAHDRIRIRARHQPLDPRLDDANIADTMIAAVDVRQEFASTKMRTALKDEARRVEARPTEPQQQFAIHEPREATLAYRYQIELDIGGQ